MDIQDGVSGTEDRLQVLYQTFGDLRVYCYRVASVVGLVCIRIFGYRDAAAEPLAENLGLAFQLTNIIRDIKEDAGHGPDLSSRGRSGKLQALPRTNYASPQFRSDCAGCWQLEADRAREYYQARQETDAFDG